MRIIQLLPSLAYGDAIGNDTLAIRDVLVEMGYNTAIYAEYVDPRLPRGTARSVELMPRLADDDVILYHGSTGTKLNYRLPEMRGRKVMIYHNITPHAIFSDYNPIAAQSMIEGIQGMQHLADKLDYCIADSEFNKKDLLRLGVTCPIDVCPIVIPFADYEKEPDQAVLRRYQDDGYNNLLFVGRVAPNKKHEDIIRAFYIYHRHFNSKSRLFLVGSYDGMEAYYQRLCRYVKKLGLEKAVIFTGKIKFQAILAYYRLADAFVCMSEHEGFCVPLVEAMYFDVPIVAYDSTAIPGTLGGSGVLLPQKDPAAAARALDRLMREPEHRAAVLEGQRRRLEELSYDTVKQRLRELLGNFLTADMPRKKRIVQVVTSVSRGDAVGNDVLAFQKTFVEMGYPSPLYVQFPDQSYDGAALPSTDKMPRIGKDEVILYHHCISTPLAGQFTRMPGKRVMVYHNVTPPQFYANYDENAEYACKGGLKNLAEMRGQVDGCIADSAFNKSNLEKAGYDCRIDVCPILIPFEDYARAPDAATVEKYSDGCTNVLFVGRGAPNKKIEDVIAAFAAYKKRDATARLILAGSYDQNGRYYQSLLKRIRQLGVRDVIFPGHISFAKILAYYRTASLFVCMSEHEGFCVPLVEAMYFDVPIVAYAATAVPETLAGGGVLLEDKSPEAVADAMEKLMQDADYRADILERQRKRLADFDNGKVKQTLWDIVAGYLEDSYEG